MYIERDLRKKFEEVSKVYKVVAIVGARQSGKTTFLKHEIKSKDKTGYVFFDDPDARELFNEDIKKFENQYILGNKITVLDEIQYCKNAGQNLKYLADKGHKLWITSSSEVLLSRDVLSYLVGRVSILKLYPLSLREFLRFKKQKETTKKILRREIYENCIYGSYPSVVLTKNKDIKKTILGDLYQTMVLKDITQSFSINDMDLFQKFVKYLSHNLGGVISYERISKRVNVSFQTMKKYLDAMEKSYFIYRVRPFFRNKIKEISKQPKVYFIDNGLRNYISKEFNQEKELSGEVFENYVLSELLKLGKEPKYWRTKTKTEVDFVVESDDGFIPIEVKLSPRFTRGLGSFIKEYKPKKAIIVNYEGENKEKFNKEQGCREIYCDVLNLKKFI